MKTTIDSAGRLVVPKALRDQLGLGPGSQVDVSVVDDHLEVAVPSRVVLQQGPHGPRFTASGQEPLTGPAVRALIEGGRR